MRNKTDKADRGIAHGLVPGGSCQERRELPAASPADATAQSQAQVPRYRERDPALDQDVRAQTRQGRPGEFETRVRELLADDPLIASLTDCMLRARGALWQEYVRLHKVVLEIVRQDEPCRRCAFRVGSDQRAHLQDVDRQSAYR
jgi:transposase